MYEDINKERAAAGLQPVTHSALLTNQAQHHASSMNYMKAQVFHSSPGTYGGECVGKGAPNWAAQVNAWMASPSYKEIILNPAFRTVGIGGSADYRVAQFA